MTLAEDQLLFECGLASAPHIAMSWQLIEMKLMYYRSDLVHPSWHEDLRKSDVEYDALEASYFQAGGDRYTTDMVDIDLYRPSVQVVISKYSKPKARLK